MLETIFCLLFILSVPVSGIVFDHLAKQKPKTIGHFTKWKNNSKKVKKSIDTKGKM